MVEYEYGEQPGILGSDRVGMMLLRDRLVPSNISDRAVAFNDELGTIRLVVPGRGGAMTALPEVNEWLMSVNGHLPV